MSLPRDVQPELLDALPAHDPQAIRSRADLRRINAIMRALPALRNALDPIMLDPIMSERSQVNLIELGAGDGGMMAQLARQFGARWPALHLSLLDMQPVVADQTLATITRCGWNVEIIRADVFDWLRNAPRRENEIIVANLFVHHFASSAVAILLSGIAARAAAFVCCEPRRSRLALMGSHCVGALGCNAVTRHDAVASVHAGFRGQEISEHWPMQSGWTTHETSAGLFLHRFVARRNAGS